MKFNIYLNICDPISLSLMVAFGILKPYNMYTEFLMLKVLGLYWVGFKTFTQ